MSRVVDITERLTFDENPKLLIKDRELEVNADAPTVLKVMSLMGQEAPGPQEILKAYELILPEKSRKKIDGLKLKFADLMVVIQEAIKLITGDGAAGGEQ